MANWTFTEEQLSGFSWLKWNEFVEMHVSSKMEVDVPLPITVDLGPVDVIEESELIAA